MKFKYLILLFFCFGISFAFAQTKLIAHKSHSGNMDNFRKSLANDLFDIECSNFGVAPQSTIRNAKLDSLIFISKEMAIMVTSEHCSPVRPDGDEGLWKEGRDTVYNHPLFSNQHELDKIKNSLRKQYFFNNSIDDTVFIGYDNACSTQQQGQN